jgi:hypothetical protein
VVVLLFVWELFPFEVLGLVTLLLVVASLLEDLVVVLLLVLAVDLLARELALSALTTRAGLALLLFCALTLGLYIANELEFSVLLPGRVLFLTSRTSTRFLVIRSKERRSGPL